MKTSRQRVLDYIRLHRYVTSSEISRTLRMTPANARHHLAVLADQGVIELTGDRPPGGKGRPAQVFCLASQGMPGLEKLTGAALDLLEGSPPSNDKNPVLRLLARYLADKENENVSNRDSSPGIDPARPRPISKPHLTQRLYEAVSRLIVLGYAARWEARPDAPRMILGNCPYAAILSDYPQLCQMDEFLLEALLEAPAKQVAKLAHDHRGAPYCLFLVSEHPEPG
jgi:predicted ArsR family transcriptional regulator